MGISFQGEDGMGCFADLFCEPMEKLRESDGTNVAILLGQVAAHELGHLLLGTNSHAAAGIKQARWTADRLTSPGLARMVFLDRESQKMRERLLGASEASMGGHRARPRQVADLARLNVLFFLQFSAQGGPRRIRRACTEGR